MDQLRCSSLKASINPEDCAWLEKEGAKKMKGGQVLKRMKKEEGGKACFVFGTQLNSASLEEKSFGKTKS